MVEWLMVSWRILIPVSISLLEALYDKLDCFEAWLMEYCHAFKARVSTAIARTGTYTSRRGGLRIVRIRRRPLFLQDSMRNRFQNSFRGLTVEQSMILPSSTWSGTQKSRFRWWVLGYSWNFLVRLKWLGSGYRWRFCLLVEWLTTKFMNTYGP